ncbi:O-methyltransferase [Nevskia ramosa]|uniref:O-methyltransferase n=1 Tax=Nevskia ramosa TaxID=64002 RepID=UPI0023548B36|nr:class I SAM-dependent methyltransferase [Nevskia ramosa]
MRPSPFSVITDARARAVLERLHEQAHTQNLQLLRHYLPQLPRLLAGYGARWHKRDLGFYDDKFIAIEAGQGALLYQLARAAQARRIVEFGSSFGVSTIWLASALRDTINCEPASRGGSGRDVVIGTEMVAAKVVAARQHIEQAGLGSYVEIREGDARETLRSLDGPIDFVLIDGFPDLALEVLQLLTPKLRCGAIVVADNLGTFKSALAGYAAHVRDPANGFTSLTLPWKGGTEFSIRQ